MVKKQADLFRFAIACSLAESLPVCRFACHGVYGFSMLVVDDIGADLALWDWVWAINLSFVGCACVQAATPRRLVLTKDPSKPKFGGKFSRANSSR